MKARNLQEYIDKLKSIYYGYKTFPNFEDLKEMFGFNSKGSVHHLFQELTQLGYLEKQGSKYVPTDKLVAMPLFESVQAGFARTVTDAVKEDVNLQHFLVDRPLTTILVKVRGDSMKDAGLMEDDIVIVDKSLSPRPGDVVIGVIDGEYTLKYYELDRQRKPYLKPANQNYPDLHPQQNLEIFGVVTGSLRKYT